MKCLFSRKNTCLLLVIVLAFSLLIAGSGFVGIGGGAGGAGGGGGESDSGEGVRIILDVPGKVRSPELDLTAAVGVANEAAEGTEIILEGITLTIDRHRINIPVGQEIASIARDLRGLKQLQSRPDPQGQRRKMAAAIADKIFHDTFTLNLEDIRPGVGPGHTFNLTAVADVSIDGEESQIVQSQEIIVSDEIVGFDNWIVGDGHVHSTYSFDVAALFPWVTIEWQARAAQRAGLDYIIMTDHDDFFYEDGDLWGKYVKDCEDAEETVGISVMPGMEVTTADGHYLAYNIDAPVVGWNDGTLRSGQEVIGEVNASSEDEGFGFIAHPYLNSILDLDWKDWDVEGFTGLEILSGISPRRPALKKWDELAMAKYDQEDPLESWVGLGNSDAHLGLQIGSFFTFINTGGETEHADIYEAIESGYAVVSEGPMVDFTINGENIGGEVTVEASEVTLVIEWPEGQRLDFINVVLNGEQTRYRVTGKDNRVHLKTIHVTVSEEGFVRVEAARVVGNRPFTRITEYAYTNPIFINIGE